MRITSTKATANAFGLAVILSVAFDMIYRGSHELAPFAKAAAATLLDFVEID